MRNFIWRQQPARQTCHRYGNAIEGRVDARSGVGIEAERAEKPHTAHVVAGHPAREPLVARTSALEHMTQQTATDALANSLRRDVQSVQFAAVRWRVRIAGRSQAGKPDDDSAVFGDVRHARRATQNTPPTPGLLVVAKLVESLVRDDVVVLCAPTIDLDASNGFAVFNAGFTNAEHLSECGNERRVVRQGPSVASTKR